MQARSARTGRRYGAAVELALALATPGVVLATAAASASAGPTGATDLTQQWGLAQIHAPAAWSGGTGTGVRIGIVDTGVDMAHPEFAGKVVAAATCMNTGGNPTACVTGGNAGDDDNGHGTHVAGIAAAAGVQVAGVAPGASLVVAKVLDSTGAGNTTDVAAGIEWVVQHGARVVNLSLGSDTGILGVNCVLGGCANAPITPAVEYAWNAGAIPVIAAGNNAGNLFGPGGYGSLDAVVVAATGPNGKVASYSSTPGNAKWGVLAPGGDDPNGPSTPTCGAVDQDEILSTYVSGGTSCYATDEGTSMATPFVSGTLALLLGRGLSPQQAVDTLLATLDRNVTCGPGQGCQGLVDAAAAMAATGPAPSGSPVATKPGAVRPSTVAPSVRTATSGGGRTGGVSAASGAPPGTSASPAAVAPAPGALPTTPRPSAGQRGAVVPTARRAPLPWALALMVLVALVAAAWVAHRRLGSPGLRAVQISRARPGSGGGAQSSGSAARAGAAGAAWPSPSTDATRASASAGARRG